MEIYIDDITRSPLEELENSFEYKETIASGAFGTVIRAIQLSNQREVAIKILKKHSWKGDTSKIKQEIAILKQLKHPNILEYIGYTETNLKLYIIMEFIRNGTLKSWIEHHTSPITEEEACVIIKNLISAVGYLHTKDFCHRDIKPENIMFANRNDLSSVKIIDFGLCAENFNGLEEYDYSGTFIYMAPEQIEKKSYSKYIDLWSIGIVMYMLLNNGKHPFYTKGDERTVYINKIKYSKLMMFNKISEMGENLLRSLLDSNPNLRLKAKGALCHPWITRNIYDPLPLNLYQSLIKASLTKKLGQAMIALIFCNSISKKSNSDNKFIINQKYIDNIDREHRMQISLFQCLREKSFEVKSRKTSIDLDNEEEKQCSSIVVNKLKRIKLKSKQNVSSSEYKSTITSMSLASSFNENDHCRPIKKNATINIRTPMKQQIFNRQKQYYDSLSVTKRHNKLSSHNNHNSHHHSHSNSILSNRNERKQFFGELSSSNPKILLPKITKDNDINISPTSYRVVVKEEPRMISISPAKNRNYPPSPSKFSSKDVTKTLHFRNKESIKDFNITKLIQCVDEKGLKCNKNKFNRSSSKNLKILQLNLPSIHTVLGNKKK